MIAYINPALALLSIALGLVGWISPRYVANMLDLAPTTSTMGLSELRAASGALFVGLGVGALWIGTPQVYAMVGFAWGFAALGRLTSILVDAAPTSTTWVFFVTEAAVGAVLLILNLLVAPAR